jgi:excisionase family DNA binding protein
MEKRILNFEEACIYTGFAESYMYKLTSSRKIPHSKPNGKKIFFDREKLDEWMLSNPIKTKEQLEKEVAAHITINKRKKR